MKMQDMEATFKSELDSVDLGAVTAASGAGADTEVGGTIYARPSRRIRAITVLVNNSEYLTWVLGHISRGIEDTTKQLGPLNPMRIPMVAMAKFMRHPNAWKLVVAQIGKLNDDQFERYWPDIVGLLEEINTDPDTIEVGASGE